MLNIRWLKGAEVGMDTFDYQNNIITNPNSKIIKAKLIPVVLSQPEIPHAFNFIAFTFGSYLGICSLRVHIFFFFSMWLCQDWRKLCQSLSNAIFLAVLAKQKHYHTLFFREIKSACYVEFVIHVGLLATTVFELQAEDSFLTDDYEYVIADISELPTFQGCILMPLKSHFQEQNSGIRFSAYCIINFLWFTLKRVHQRWITL